MRARRLLYLAAGLAVLTSVLSGLPAAAQHGPGPAGTRLFVPPADPNAVNQIRQLVRDHDLRDAVLLARMVTTPQAVWFTSGTPDQVEQNVAGTMARARHQHAVPTLVAYDIPGRDCAQFSAGGALNQAAYQAWIDGFAAGLGDGRAIVILEPDALGNMPSDCGLPASVYPFTNDERTAEINFAVDALAADPNVSVYLDGTHSAWQAVGTITQRLLAAGVQRAQGVYLNVSNYQPTAELIDYGTWISDCIAIVTDPANPLFGNPSACASQYFPATQTDFSTWHLTTEFYAAHMGDAVATTHFVIDTSRNGQGPNDMTAFANPPFNQPAAVIAKLASGNWCNPPNSGLGLRPTTNTGTPLLDAYLWVKTPGQSDGQCDAAGGVRAWDYSLFTQPGWPTTAADQQVFDPLWGMNDPAAGAWFPQQALQLAQEANPSLLGR
ncbi:MAG TPA: glycoside hydrolase family 6 protein [Pseudonocardiaceae bacterium]|nr:glycoside hydrolase family 6 protein [Pseudonocardiaceae bacterium]